MESDAETVEDGEDGEDVLADMDTKSGDIYESPINTADAHDDGFPSTTS